MGIHKMPQVRRHEVVRKIQELARRSERVALAPHARQRMQQRELTYIQVLRCLQQGQQDGEPELDEHDCWRVRFRHRTAGVRITVVAVLTEDEKGHLVLVVTAFQ